MDTLTQASPSEHWLTVMACTVCHQTPDESPLYQCHLGHLICYNCFKRLAMYGLPKCPDCKSDNFHVVKVATEFLRKLKTKPGIGRPCRYAYKKPPTPVDSSVGDSEPDLMTDHTITVEKLFRLNKEQLASLFNESPNRNRDDTNQYSLQVANVKVSPSGKFIFKDNYRRKKFDNFQSKKPLICPHDPCHKIISISSCQTHFKHDHSDLPKYCIEREQVLHLRINPEIMQASTTLCLGLISVYDINRLPICNKTASNLNLVKKLNQRTPIDTFWMMVSGSSCEDHDKAYVIFWLFTDKANHSDFYTCTIDISSENDKISYSTFCDVNDVYDSQNTMEIAQNLNCLHLSYGCLETLLKEGPKFNLRIIIH